MSNKIQDIFKSEFVVNVSTLMSGSVISQIIPFLVAPIISRLYNPEDYALVAAYNSITVLLTIVATGMYSSALMIDKTDDEALNTAVAAFLVTITITVISLLVFLVFNDSIVLLTGNEDITFWLYLIPLTVFFTGGYQTLNMWNNRLKRYKRLAYNKVIQTIVTSVATLLLGFLSYHSIGLMISLLLGQMSAFGVLFYQTIGDDVDLFKEIKSSQIKSSFIRYKDFPKYNMPQGFLDGMRESSILLIISNYFGPVILGSYSFAMSMLSRPLQLLGTSFNQVFYQKSTERYNSGKEIRNMTLKVVFSLVLVSLTISIPIVFWGKEIFLLFFGDKWGLAGNLSSILILWIGAKFILSTVSTIPLTFGKQKFNLMLSIFSNSLPPLVLFIFAYGGFKIFTTILGFVISNILFSIAGIFWFMRIIKIKQAP